MRLYWNAVDYRDEVNSASTSHVGNPAYNGLNVYGDEAGTTFNWDQMAGTPAGTLGSQRVTRTGYTDNDLMNNIAKSVKFAATLNYRPFGDDRLEVILNSKFGTGNTVYQGQNRYNIKNFTLAQHRLEFRGKNFFVRGYMTAENAGDSYDTRFAALNINREWSSDTTWFQEYAGAYLGALAGLGVPGMDHAAARAFADRNRFVPGSTDFEAAKEKITNDPNLLTGSKFQDQTKLYHGDVNYNFRDVIDFAEIQVGGSLRQYSLNSSGTIFTDYDGAINYNELGVYVQGQKKLLEDRLKVTASARYDKAQNFDGNVSPRLSLSYAAGEDKNHNFRASIQTGFRNPTTQDQYIGLDAGAGILIGTAPDNIDRYRSLPFSLGINQGLAGYLNAVGGTNIGSTQVLTGDMAYNNSWSASSIGAFLASGNPADLKKSDIEFVQPEFVTAYEVGYRGVIEGFTLDVNAYYNMYQDFIASRNAVAPLYGSVALNDAVDIAPAFGSPVPMPTPVALIALQSGDFKGVAFDSNSDSDISSYGLGVGVSKKVFDGFNLGVNYTYAKFEETGGSNPDFEAGFNTPEHKVKVQFGKEKLLKNFGFNVNYRWQDSFLWESSFYDGMVAARSVVDAQVNYAIPSLKSIIKLGGANLGGKEYFSAPGVGATGSQYYLSWTINN